MLRKIREMLKCQNGFTLVELMAVIAIIGVLAAIAIPRYTSAIDDAAVAKVRADLRSIDSAVAVYVANNPAAVAADLTAVNLGPYFQAGTLPTPPASWTGVYTPTLTASTINGGTAATANSSHDDILSNK